MYFVISVTSKSCLCQHIYRAYSKLKRPNLKRIAVLPENQFGGFASSGEKSKAYSFCAACLSVSMFTVCRMNKTVLVVCKRYDKHNYPTRIFFHSAMKRKDLTKDVCNRTLNRTTKNCIYKPLLASFFVTPSLDLRYL